MATINNNLKALEAMQKSLVVINRCIDAMESNPTEARSNLNRMLFDHAENIRHTIDGVKRDLGYRLSADMISTLRLLHSKDDTESEVKE